MIVVLFVQDSSMQKPACSPATTLGKTDDPKCYLVPLQHDSDSSISLLSLTMYQTQQKKHTAIC